MSGIEFEGVGGSIIVSIIAFSIVFAVLLGLTVMIYAMRLFAGGDEQKKNDGVKAQPAAQPQAAAKPAAPVAAPVAPAANITGGVTGLVAQPQAVVAAITAAILEATNGLGQIVSIVPEAAVTEVTQVIVMPAKRWKNSGVVRLVENGIDRGWRR